MKKEDKKRFIIVISSIVLIVLFSLLIFSPQVFVGKAIESGEEIFDVQLVDGDIVVSLTSATRNVAGISFDMTSESLTCADLTFEKVLDWEFFEMSCVDDVFTFGTATVNDFVTGTFDVVNVAGELPASFEVSVDKLNAYGTDGTQLFEEASGTFTIAKPEDKKVNDTGTSSSGSSSSSSSSSSSGSGGGGSAPTATSGNSFTCEREWGCSAWSECTNGEQSRTCLDKNECPKTKTVRLKTYPVVPIGKDKPVEVRDCDMPVKVEVQEPVPPVKKPTITEIISEKKVFIIVPSIVILLVCGLVLLHLFRRKPELNLNQKGKKRRKKVI